MEDRQTAALWLELAAADPAAYARDRVDDVAARPGVARASWWTNQCPDRTDLPRRLPEFATLGVYELDDGFSPPPPAEGVTGLHLARTPRPGQGTLGGDATTGLLLVLISPKDPARAQELRDWGDFVHLRHIAEAAVPGYRMITPYEQVGGHSGDPDEGPRFLHLYEMHSDDPEATYRSMTPMVRERLHPAAFDAWAWHPQLRIDYVNTFALAGEAAG